MATVRDVHPDPTAPLEFADAWLTLPELAHAIGEPLPKIRQWIRDGRIVAFLRGSPRAQMVPADFVADGALVKGLSGALTLLRDAGYTAEEAVAWLLAPDESLPGRPIDALAANRGAEVKRRAQALAL